MHGWLAEKSESAGRNPFKIRSGQEVGARRDLIRVVLQRTPRNDASKVIHRPSLAERRLGVESPPS
jgi:hypothetical protein